MKKLIAYFSAATMLLGSVWVIPPQRAYALAGNGESTEEKESDLEMTGPEAEGQEVAEPDTDRPEVAGPDTDGLETASQGTGTVSPERTGAMEAALQEVLAEHSVMALVYLEDLVPLMQEASFDGQVLAEVPTGQTVFIRDVCVDEEGMEWVLAETSVGGESCQGYLPRYYLACSDEDFLQWESKYIGPSASEIAAYSVGPGQSADIEAFPESYREALYALKEKHPNWIFVKMNTGLNWTSVIQNEMKNDRSLVYKTNPEYVKGECYDDGNWYYATEDILKYYMDPRNGLTEDAVFQFELLTYNDTYHTEGAVDVYLNNTFMNNTSPAPGTNMTFAHIFYEVGSELNVSPFHLAARVYQEQQGGTSALISGTYEGYEGYYNYFNIRASGTTKKEIIESGLKYARANGWSDAYKSILGGSKVISANYISKGQDTLYLQKFNVNAESPYGLYNHQYMQNIIAPSSEGKKVMGMYRGINSLENTFVFKIPVYGNMPASASPMPTGYTGLKYDETAGWQYLENGAVNYGYYGLIEYDQAWWCVSGGRVNFGYTGLWNDPKVGWWYVKNGAVDFDYDGLKEYGGTWWCVSKGRVDFGYTGLWNDPEVGWWYVKNGAVDFTYSGLIEYDQAWWCVSGGRVDFGYSGLWNDPEVGWWYVKNGAVDFDYDGLKEYGGAWWCVSGGQVDFGYSGLWNDPEVGWWYVKNGMVDFDSNGLMEYEGDRWCVSGGQVDFGYTGLWNDSSGWWYVGNGRVDENFTGIASNEFGYWYCEKGQLNFDYTGEVTYEGTTYTVVSGAATVKTA